MKETPRSFAKYNRRLTEQYAKWMMAMHYATTTRRIYLKVLERYLEFMGEKAVTAASHMDIRFFIARESEDGATLNCVYRYLGTLRQFYDFLNLGGLVSYVAPRFVRMRVPWHGRPGTLTEDQIRKVIAATRTLRERALVEFFYSTGCRLSEALLVKIEDIDLTTRSARVRGKLGKVRLVLLAESAANAVRDYIDQRTSGFVFIDDYGPPKGHFSVHDNQWISRWRSHERRTHRWIYKGKVLGSAARMSHAEAKHKHEAMMARVNSSRPKRTRPLCKVTVQHLIKDIARRAGVKNVSPHTFRRTFATHLHEHGASLAVIRALMGHVWVQTTMKYAQIGPDGLTKAFEKCHPLGNRHDNAPS